MESIFGVYVSLNFWKLKSNFLTKECFFRHISGVFSPLFLNIISHLIIDLNFPFDTAILYDDFYDIIVA